MDVSDHSEGEVDGPVTPKSKYMTQSRQGQSWWFDHAKAKVDVANHAKVKVNFAAEAEVNGLITLKSKLMAKFKVNDAITPKS